MHYERPKKGKKNFTNGSRYLKLHRRFCESTQLGLGVTTRRYSTFWCGCEVA